VTVLWLLGGLIGLVAGAELLVRGASRIAMEFRIPPLIVGLTVVAFGTSAPELAVSTNAALAGSADIAIGNVVGSNIFNVLVILGLSALIKPLVVAPGLGRIDVPVMIGSSITLLIMAWDGRLDRLEGVLLLMGMAAYMAYLIAGGRRAVTGGPGAARPERRGIRGRVLDAALIAVGLVLLVLGSGWVVDGAQGIAARMGVSELIIGVTIVAAGTSLPELTTSLVATLRGQRDIAIGNVVGSNIFNILAILGIAATLTPAGLEATATLATFDLPVMTAVAIICLPVFISGARIARWEGLTLLVFYVAYTIALAADATGYGGLPDLRGALVYAIISLIAVGGVVIAVRALQRTGP
jgi:cation:H+ antiporter